MTANKQHLRQFIAIFEDAAVKLADSANGLEREMTNVIIDLLQTAEEHALDEALTVLELHPKCLMILSALKLEEELAGEAQEH